MATLVAKALFIFFSTILFILSGRGFFKTYYAKNRPLTFFATIVVVIFSVFSLYTMVEYGDQVYSNYKQTKLEREAWAKTLLDGSIDDFKSYVSNFPEGKYVDIANQKISSINEQSKQERELGAWSIVSSQKSKKAYQAYIDLFSGSENIEIAKQELAVLYEMNDDETEGFLRSNRLLIDQEIVEAKEGLAWQFATTLGTLEAYQHYKTLFPQGIYLRQANENSEILEEQQNAQNSRDFDYSKSGRVLEVDIIKHDSSWELVSAINTEIAYLTYIREFPSGAKISEAKARLAELEAKDRNENSPQNTNLRSTTDVDSHAHLSALKLVKIPAGIFKMGDQTGHGSSSERPVFSVKVDRPFFVSKYEITNSQWSACFDSGGCDYSPPETEGAKLRNSPVSHVSWNDAKQYVQWLRSTTKKPFRLLSEAEWEYMARSNEKSAYPWGKVAGRYFSNYGNDDGSGGVAINNDRWVGVAPVGSFVSNNFDVFDAHGNVSEWVEDCSYGYNDYFDGSSPRKYQSQLPIEKSNCGARVARGGSYEDPPLQITSSSRKILLPDSREAATGLRVAMFDMNDDTNSEN